MNAVDQTETVYAAVARRPQWDNVALAGTDAQPYCASVPIYDRAGF